ncbi:YlmC/YmxH family sporulation protein [Melghirimyces profundicolus]|uniref:YlmC/YmxH family sporulation protein n=1 Tax=Melghirimyces profundicolus TaxID=1242148 RepID=A0A2T6B790_9BACL|nr:YlmC/YmxH family sporulation protein [Melghirimyces profundicolus]PTX51951.1 YlmC/YmxH family sporulation protein [Melghirimyces profundicolus]
MIKISELQDKDVVNVSDGRKLGQIYDLEIDLRLGKIKALVVPGESRVFGLFTGGKEWVIPWNQIVRIGADVILVRLDSPRSYDAHEDRESRPLLNTPKDSGD